MRAATPARIAPAARRRSHRDARPPRLPARPCARPRRRPCAVRSRRAPGGLARTRPRDAQAFTARRADRAAYLARPDLGRRLDAASRSAVAAAPRGCDLVFVIADGLSAQAVASHALPLIDASLPVLRRDGWRIGPVAVVAQGRVAIGDEIGEILGAAMVCVLIGERPGLTSPDSLGVYLTWQPRIGRTDAERNCLSNIRPAGMAYVEASAASDVPLRAGPAAAMYRRHAQGRDAQDRGRIEPFARRARQIGRSQRSSRRHFLARQGQDTVAGVWYIV